MLVTAPIRSLSSTQVNARRRRDRGVDLRTPSTRWFDAPRRHVVPTHGARKLATVGALTGRVSAGGAGGAEGSFVGWQGHVCRLLPCVHVRCCGRVRSVAGASLRLPVHAHYACCSAPWRRRRPAMALGRQCALCCVSDRSKWFRACSSNFRYLGSCLPAPCRLRIGYGDRVRASACC